MVAYELVDARVGGMSVAESNQLHSTPEENYERFLPIDSRILRLAAYTGVGAVLSAGVLLVTGAPVAPELVVAGAVSGTVIFEKFA